MVRTVPKFVRAVYFFQSVDSRTNFLIFPVKYWINALRIVSISPVPTAAGAGGVSVTGGKWTRKLSFPGLKMI